MKTSLAAVATDMVTNQPIMCFGFSMSPLRHVSSKYLHKWHHLLICGRHLHGASSVKVALIIYSVDVE